MWLQQPRHLCWISTLAVPWGTRSSRPSTSPDRCTCTWTEAPGWCRFLHSDRDSPDTRSGRYRFFLRVRWSYRPRSWKCRKCKTVTDFYPSLAELTRIRTYSRDRHIRTVLDSTHFGTDCWTNNTARCSWPSLPGPTGYHWSPEAVVNSYHPTWND